MCGLAGVFDPDGLLDGRVHLGAMTDRMALRGPDDQGAWHDATVSLGHRRLSILDLGGGHQPMVLDGEQPLVVVFNGEIYNWAELRPELERAGARFATRSDTEVILWAYRCWGERFVERIDGMFALALWDARAQRLVLARDRFGKKPLYYAPVGNGLVFASTLDALLAHPAVPRQLDDAALVEYLALEYVVAPRTMLAGVHKLPAATLATKRATPSPLALSRFWQPPPLGTLQLPFDDALAELRRRLEAAVATRLVADVPVGIFLSGGLDSSTVAALAARQHRGIETFSIAFDDPTYDESPHARKVARHLGTRHHEERLSLDVALGLVAEVGELWDEPVGDGSIVPTYLLSRFARTRVKVALGGDGGDELFAGYPTYRAHRVLGWLPTALPAPIATLLQRGLALLPTSHGYFSLDFVLGKLLGGLAQPRAVRNAAWLGAADPPLLSELLPGQAHDDPYAVPRRLYEASRGSHLERVLQQDLALYLTHAVLAKVDRASMAASLEVRAPLLDTRVAELALAMPLGWKLHGLEGKHILKRLAEQLLPADIVHRKKKGFGMPIGAWLQGPLGAHLSTLLLGPTSLAGSGRLHRPAVERLVVEHRAGRANHRQVLWSLLVLESWRRAKRL